MAEPVSNPFYSIVVPAYNEAGELPATLASIRKAMAQQPVAGECIVVDNNSNDATAATARDHGADRVVFEPVNQIARARNTGATASKSPLLVFIDADTRISAPLLTATLERFESGACVGGGALVRFEGPVTPVGQAGIRLWEFISKTTRTAAGSYFFCRRDAFFAVGGFDEKLYASEEVRLSSKLKKQGAACGQTFDIITDHPVTTSARKLRWHSGPRILAYACLCLVPMAVRSRYLCGFWYKRPMDDE